MSAFTSAVYRVAVQRIVKHIILSDYSRKPQYLPLCDRWLGKTLSSRNPYFRTSISRMNIYHPVTSRLEIVSTDLCPSLSRRKATPQNPNIVCREIFLPLGMVTSKSASIFHLQEHCNVRPDR